MGGFSLLGNIAFLQSDNALQLTQQELATTLYRLATGNRINSGADDPAGLSIADALHVNETALNQSSLNANAGIGKLQVADGALAQVTNLLDRAVTLATEAANGTVTSTQATALNEEFTSIKAQIDNIGQNTTYNGQSVFSTSSTSIFISDGVGSYTIGVEVNTLGQSQINAAAGSGLSAVNLSSDNLTSVSSATAALSDINSAIDNVSSKRGEIGASVDQLQSAVDLINVQVDNLTAAEQSIRGVNLAQEMNNLAQYNILYQTGMSATAQANTVQAAVLSLLK